MRIFKLSFSEIISEQKVEFFFFLILRGKKKVTDLVQELFLYMEKFLTIVVK